jgi:phosphoribosylanthranilate isomerase
VVVEVKVCGLTRPADAAEASAGGAEYLGVVFASGPRVVSASQAASIVAAAAGRPVFGVFGAQSVDEILRVARAAGLHGAQLHGPYSAGDAHRLRREGLLVWRVVRLDATAGLDALGPAAEGADAVLVEARVAGRDGGAGVPLALGLAARARESLPGRMVLAGGLRPETVARAVGLVRPDVVDVSSGVERLPGIKDPHKMACFLEAVRGLGSLA